MRHQPGRSRTAEIRRGLGALIVLLLLLAGFPAALTVVAGSPIPHGVPSWAQITATLTQPDTGNTLFLAVVKVIGWIAWILFAIATLAETVAYLRGCPARRLPRPIRPMQHLARDLVATVALLISTGAPLANSTTASLTHETVAAADERPTDVRAANTMTPSAVFDGRVRLAAHEAPTTEARPWKTRVITRGDSLWAIARHEYGSGIKYLRIFNASKHLTQPHGLPNLTDPDRIYPGQHLKIPTTGNGGATHPARHRTPGHAHDSTPPPAASPSQTGRPSAAAPANPTPNPTTARSSATASPPAASSATPAASPTATTPPPTGQPGTASQPATGHAPATPTPAPPAAPARSAHPRPEPTPSEPAHPQDQAHGAPVAVRLPSGAYVGLGLAGAISLALAATRLHRRRRRPHLDEWPDPTGTDPAPPPPAPVARARKTHLDTLTHHSRPIPSDADLLTQDATTPPPGQLTIGTRDGRDLTITLGGLNLALTGPGNLDAARAIMTELLAKSRRYRVELLIPEPDATALLAGTGIDAADLASAVPGLVITASLAAAITHLEAEIIHRARLMETTDQPDVAALRQADPGEPLPAVILIATAPAAGDTLQAILQLGRPYDVGGLLLGDWGPGTTLTLATDGTSTRATGPDAGTWSGARLFHLPAADAGPMLQVIRTANGAPEPQTPGPPATPLPPKARPDTTSPAEPSPRPAPTRPPSTATPHQETATADSAPSRPVQLHLLGAVRLDAGGETVATGLRRIARDLLAYLALHPDGITRDQGIDALMPGRDPDTGTTMLHTGINNVRKTLRAATGLRQPMFINHTAGRYHLDPTLIDVDLWHLQTVLHQAQHATSDAERVTALQQIPDLYTGELADDLTYEWAETERERLRRHATDALAHLARLLQDHHPERALAVLEQAIDHDRYAEPLYQDLMRLQAQLGRLDAVRRTYQLLTNRLADLDVEPDEETDRLRLKLLRPTTEPTRRRPPPRDPRPSGQGRPGQSPNAAGAPVLRLHSPDRS
ncbi:BTAD domain-containing putative transcriptional regulator [Actinoallomurus sp. NPDC052274]|uniref:BTAD domain-containing putative transcriptional regulator n=1 Tax=Actinoallomurus sp. NPDC052274 TaxID=3155420 RepID=UPI00344615F0